MSALLSLRAAVQNPDSAKISHNVRALCRRLRQNDRGLTELSLGWYDSDFLHPAYGRALQEAIQLNHRVSSVSIGWRYDRRTLFVILQAVAKLPSLKSLRLVLDDVVTDALIGDVLRPGLENLEIRARSYAVEAGYGAHQKVRYRHSNITMLMPSVVKVTTLRTLKLAECDIDDDRAIAISSYLQMNDSITRLSIRSNKWIGKRGLKAICHSKSFEWLDLSLCDIGDEGALTVARALNKHHHDQSTELLFCGNYRLGTEGAVALARCRALSHLDLSFCSIGEVKFTDIANALESNDRLTKLSLKGIELGSHGCEALGNLLKHNDRLRSLAINFPRDPKPLEPENAQMIIDGLRENYNLEDLAMDYQDDNEKTIERDLHFFLRLNIAGRRILRRPNAKHSEWIEVLAKLAEHIDISFWFLRESSDRLRVLTRQS